MRIRPGKKASGFTLIEIMVSMGLLSIMAMVVFTLNNFMNTRRAASDAAFNADQIRKDVLVWLNFPMAWKYTLLNNATFACVRAGASGHCETGINQGPPDYTYSSLNGGIGACAAGICQGGFDVYSYNKNTSTASIYYQGQSSATTGFTKNGSPCTTWAGTYNSTSKSWTGGTSKCPFRLVLYWQPVCPSNVALQCANPPIHVKGYLIFSPSSQDALPQSAFNSGNFGIDVILPPNFN